MDDRTADSAATAVLSASRGDGGLYRLVHPLSERPIIAEVPHAGIGVPPPLRKLMAVDERTRLRDSDIFMDEIAQEMPARGATLLAANLSRYVVDLNRDPSTGADESLPSRGAVWTRTSDGQRTHSRPPTTNEVTTWIAQFHEPYHEVLTSELIRLRQEHGEVVLLAMHSMPSRKRGGAEVGADIVPGTQGRTSAHGRLIDAVDAHFRAAGLRVRHDAPYKGGWSTVHYGKPPTGVHAIQIEVNRALYANERSSSKKAPGFETLKSLCAGLVDATLSAL